MISRLLSSPLFLSCKLLHISFILLASSVTVRTTFAFTNDTDKQSLLAIKDQILEDPFKVLSSWNDSIHFCNWKGVTCSRLHQRATVLNLSSSGLVGSLSPCIGNLTFLRVIHLDNNSFHGTIPQEIGGLFRLQHLSLGMNFFQGELPTNLTHCSNIQVIRIYENNLSGKIPSELGSLSNLLQLILFSNNFTGKIPSSLGNLSALHILSLMSNNLEGSIPFELGQLSNLEFLQLASNNLSGKVPTPLYNISSIYYFAIPINQLHGSLPPDLGLTLPRLQVFYVGGNHLSGPLPPSIVNASGLLHFDIGKNTLTGPVPMNLGSLRDLQMLKLFRNLLGTNKSNDLNFLNSLTNCTNLRILEIGKNHFGGLIPNSIANLSTKLSSLWMDQNYLSGSIPRGIGNLINLEILALNQNLLTGRIPESIGKLSQLQEVYIYQNYILGNIPSSVGNISRLSVLVLANNMLEESIPASLGNCKNLQVLDLGYNHLTGAIPEQVFELPSLTIGLWLTQNHLTGPLPLQVGNLKNLGELDISGNKLSGEIPSSLGDCLVLEFLHMGDNLFEGTIPSSLRQLRGIGVLNLSHNHLSGQIPQFLGELPLIQSLDLSYNMFEGEVPSEEVFRNVSAFSIVGNYRLCGGIKALQLPACPIKVPEKQRKPSARKVIILATTITLSVTFMTACVCATLYQIRRSKGKSSPDLPSENQYPTLSYVQLHQATNGFSSNNLIGEGRYGSVYRGTLDSSEQVVAVKVLKLQQRGADKSFLAECEALRNIRHRNLVKVITICSSIDLKGNDFKALIFEFMPNGSLESWLYPTLSEQEDLNSSVLPYSMSLNLIQRLNISIDVASALDYLHHHCETAIIHCDLKPSNVLLDENFCAHVTDFGQAKFLITTKSISDHKQCSSSVGIRGTVGYVAPEYSMGVEVSTQGNLYSYGILLLEMFTGKRPTDNMFTDDFNLHNYAKMALPDRVVDVADSLLTLDEEDTFEKISQQEIDRIKECLVSVLRIGVICSAELPRKRLDIKDVLNELHRIRNTLLGDKRE